MLNRFKLWIFYYVTNKMLESDIFIMQLHNRLLKEQKRREEIKEQAKRLVQQAQAAKREAEQLKSAQRTLSAIKKPQDQCEHLKGGQRKNSRSKQDYAIWDHAFTDGSRSVQCLICAKEWRGDELNSPEVLHMLANTTNTKSSSQEAQLDSEHSPGYQVVFRSPLRSESIKEQARNFSVEEPFAPFISKNWWDRIVERYNNVNRWKARGK
jgi:hypothetical protein